MIYFIREVRGGGPVKIGHSFQPEVRLRALMANSPYPLEIVARLPGGRAEEARFHLRFDHVHSHLEWFRQDPDLDAMIAEINSGVFDVDRLPKGTSGIISRRAARAWAAKSRWHSERAA